MKFPQTIITLNDTKLSILTKDVNKYIISTDGLNLIYITKQNGEKCLFSQTNCVLFLIFEFHNSH